MAFRPIIDTTTAQKNKKCILKNQHQRPAKGQRLSDQKLGISCYSRGTFSDYD